MAVILRRPWTRNGFNGLAARWGLVSYWNLYGLDDAYGLNLLTNNAGTTFTAGKINNAATFASASSQYLSCASNARLQTGDVDFWVYCWVKHTTLGANRGILAKSTDGTTREYDLFYRLASLAHRFQVLDAAGAAIGTATWTSAPSTGVWYPLMAYHDSVNNLVAISQDNGAFVTAVTTGTPAANASVFTIGTIELAEFMNGQIALAAFGKSPPLGIAALANEIRNTLYAGGNGQNWPILNATA